MHHCVSYDDKNPVIDNKHNNSNKESLVKQHISSLNGTYFLLIYKRFSLLRCFLLNALGEFLIFKLS